jgi:hypothetical protein
MPPSIAPPPPDVLARALEENAQRFPEKFEISVPGDRGKEIKLPVVLGIPSGALPLDDKGNIASGRKPAPGWGLMIASALGFREETPDELDDFVRDCVLWPPRATWNTWRDEWPGMGPRVLRDLKKKIARGSEFIDTPDDDQEPPAEIKLSRRGLWRILKPAPGIVRSVAVEPVDAETWRMYMRAMRLGEDAPKHTRAIVDMATGGTVSDVLDRYPGFVLMLASLVAYLAGCGAEVERGNW